MLKTIWNKGAPPEIGWWPASVFLNTQSIRWWNGHFWSLEAYPDDFPKRAEEAAKIIPLVPQNEIEWSERWWL
jgi:hypothetical protein